MRKLDKIIIITLFIILLSSFVTSIKIDSGLTHYYNFTQGANDTFNTADGGFDGTITRISTTPDNDDGKGYKSDGTGSAFYVSLSSDSFIDSNTFTTCFWFNTTNTGVSLYGWGVSPLIFDLRNDGTNLEYFIRDSSSVARNSPNPDDITASYQDFQWHYYCARLNSSNRLSSFFDGVKVDDKVTTISSGDWSIEDIFALGALGFSPRQNWKLTEFDELSFYSTALNDSQILEIYNGTDVGTYCSPIQNPNGCSIPSNVSITKSINLTTNLTNNINSSLNPYYFSINSIGSVVNTTDLWNITVWYNNTLNQTHLNIPLNVSIFILNLTYGNLQTAYDITINVSHGIDNVNNSITRTNIFLDSVIPTLTTSFINNSLLFHNIQNNVDFNITCSDLNLFACNSTIYILNSTGARLSVINNTFLTNITSLTTTTVKINFTNNINGLNFSRYEWVSTVWDSHTSNQIQPYKTDKLVDGYMINDKIKITSPDLIDMNLIKQKDRYSFDMEFNKAQPEIYLESTEDLTFIQNSQYKGHFVDFNNKKWIDFQEELNGEVVIFKINNKKYKIVPQDNYKKNFKFKSIGDLNTVKKSYYFNVTKGYSIYAKDSVANTTLTNYTIELYNTTGSLIQNKSTTNGNLTFNITSGTYIGNVSANLYITNSTGNTIFTSGGSKTVYLVAANSLYLFIYDEQTNTLITDRNVTLDVINYENVSSSYTTNTGSTFQSGFAAGDYEINYKADNYTARSYYTTITGSDTQTIKLYSLLDTDTTHQYLNYDIVDESASPLPNATLKMQRYYITDGVWRTVEMSISNDIGQGFIFSELYDVTYRFIIEYPMGTTKKISSKFKLDTRDLFFSISLLDVGLTNYYSSGDVATTLVYSNTSKVWTYSYNAASLNTVTQGRFLVTKVDPNLITTVCNTTVSSNSGGMTCNLTSYSNEDSTFMGQGFVTFTADNLEYFVKGASLKIKEEHLTYGFNGIYLSMIIVGTMAFIGLFSPIISIIMALFGLVISNAIGILYLNPTWLISIIIVGLVYIYSMREK